MKRRNPRLAQTTLPIMRETANELRRLLALRSTRNRELQEVLLSDPAAAIAVFRELNHTRPGAGEQVTDAAHAVSMIGMDPFRRLVESLPEVASRSPDEPVSHGPASAYSQAAHAAFYAAALSEYKGVQTTREIPTAALLQNPAILALWATEPESALRASNAVRDGVPPEVAYGAELGESLEDANRHLASTWALPRLARQAMGDWDDFNPRPHMVRLADGLAQSTAAGWQREDTETLTAALAEFLDLSRDQACAWLHGQAIDAARALSRFDYPLPGFELMFMPGEVEKDPDDDRDDIPLMGGQRPHEQPQKPAAAPDLHGMMAEVMRRIRVQTGAARVVFAMLNKDRSRLRTRLALGGNADDGLRRLDLDLSQRNLFSALMGKPQSLWLNQRNARQYQGYLPVSLRQMLAPEGAYMMSLFVGNRPLGLMLGDGSGLSDQGYRHFRDLCHEATGTLTAGSRLRDPAAS